MVIYKFSRKTLQQWIWAGNSDWNDIAYFITKISALEAPAQVRSQVRWH